MKIDKKLNLVVGVDTEGVGRVWVHSTPLSREIYQNYALILAKAWAAITSHGLSIITGPKVAALMIEQIAKELKVWEGVEGNVKNGLMAEIRRLTNVVVPLGKGWDTLPLETAIVRGVISEDDLAELEGLICFFILTSAMTRRATIPGLLAGMNALWGTQSTLLDSTAYASSLRTLTEAANTGATAEDASQPS